MKIAIYNEKPTCFDQFEFSKIKIPEQSKKLNEKKIETKSLSQIIFTQMTEIIKLANESATPLDIFMSRLATVKDMKYIFR